MYEVTVLMSRVKFDFFFKKKADFCWYRKILIPLVQMLKNHLSLHALLLSDPGQVGACTTL